MNHVNRNNRLINLQVCNFYNKSMQRKPPYCLPTEETEDGSSEQNPRSLFINSLDQANIIDVWSENFHEEMEKISILTKKYNIIAIDTEFPSIEQYNEKFCYKTESDHQKYLRLSKNVDCTTLIQLGMCLTDQEGNVPVEKFCWQFNFKFEGEIEEISSSSAYLLRKAGIGFQKLRSQGISYKTFTHEFIKSGLLLNKHNKWVVFHGSYDFLYMLKLIRNESCPKSTEEFYKSIKIYFPQKVDLKLVIQREKRMKKLGLSKLADSISCRRIGPQHQAGSDALLTLQCYFKLKQDFDQLMESCSDMDNMIFGIGSKEISPNYGQNFYPQYGYQQTQNYPYYYNNQPTLQYMQNNFVYYQQYPNIESNQCQYPQIYTQNGYFCYPYSSNQAEYDEKEEK